MAHSESHPERPRRRSPRALERHIVDLAELFGWRHHRSRLGITSDGAPDGFPSETLVRGDRLVFVAPLGPTEKPIKQEQDWLDALRRVTTVEVYVFRSDDLQVATDALRPIGGR